MEKSGAEMCQNVYEIRHLLEFVSGFAVIGMEHSGMHIMGNSRN